MTLTARIAEVELGPAHREGARLPDGSPDPLACDQILKQWCESHPTHHVEWVRYHPRPDGTLTIVMETSTLHLPLDGWADRPTLGGEG